MKKYLFLVGLLPYSLQSQTIFLEDRNIKTIKSHSVPEPEFLPTFHGDVLFPLGKKFHVGVYFEFEKESVEDNETNALRIGGEVLPLVEYEVSRSVELGCGLGYQNFHDARAAASFQWKTESNNLFWFSEFLGSGFWYHSYYNRWITQWIGFGIVAQQEMGAGLRIQLRPNEKSPLHGFSVWGSYCVNPDKMRAALLFGLRYHHESKEPTTKSSEENP